MFTVQTINRIGGVMVSVLASSAVDRGFEPRSGHTKDRGYKIGICCLEKNAAKHDNIKEKDQRLVGLESE